MQMWQRARRFSMDAELDKHFKEAWCKRHSLNHPRLAAYASASAEWRTAGDCWCSFLRVRLTHT